MEIGIDKYITASMAAIVAILLLVGAVMATVPPVTAPTTATVTVNEWVSVTLSNAPVTFSSMDPGSGPINATVGNGFPLTATLGSETNVNIKIETKANATNFVHSTNASLTFPVSNMKWDEATTGPWTNYTTSDAMVCTGLGASGTCNIYHQLTVPSAQAAGAYSVGITVTASKA